MTGSQPARVLLVTVPAVALAGSLALPHPPLTRDRGFVVTSPADGGSAPGEVLVAWTSARGAASYAVVVDRALPAPGDVVEPGPQTVLVDGRLVALTLGPATTGSPSARDQHTVVVLPLDRDHRRLGESTASVHLRVPS